MNKLQQQSLQAKDARHVTEILDEGLADASANHAKTQAMIGELLNRSVQSDAKALPLTFGGVVMSRDFYNLFVIGGEKFKSGVFTVPRTMVFMAEYIEPEVKKRFLKLRDDKIVEQILSLPSLFMSENKDYMKSRPGQKTLFGRITDLTIEPNDIRISFEADIQIFQQSITDISHDLKIVANPGNSELNNTHWTIKRIDLLKVLAEKGLLALRDT